MPVLGCLLLVILPLVGLLLGSWLAGSTGMYIGAGIGFAVALSIFVVSGLALAKASRNR